MSKNSSARRTVKTKRCRLHVLLAKVDSPAYSVPGLISLVDSAQGSIALALSIVVMGLRLSEGLVEIVLDVNDALARFIHDYNGSCPNLQPLLCENLQDYETCTSEEMFSTFKNLVREYSTFDFQSIVQSAEDARNLLLDMQAIMIRSDNFLNNVDWLFSCAMFFTILLVCLCLATSASLFLDLKPWVRRWSYRFFFPVFVFLVSFSFIFSIAFVITSTSFSDACVDSPDDRVRSILQAQVQSMPPFRQEMVRYIISRK